MRFFLIGLLILSSCSSYNQNTRRGPSSDGRLSEFELGISKTEISENSCIKYDDPRFRDSEHVSKSSNRLQCGSFIYDTITIAKSKKAKSAFLAFGTGHASRSPIFHGDPDNINFGPEVNWVYIYDYERRKNHYIGAYYYVEVKENDVTKNYLVVVGFQDKKGGYAFSILSVLEDNLQATAAHQLLISFYEGEKFEYRRCDALISEYRGCENEYNK